MNDKEIFDALLELINFHCKNNDVSFSEGIGVVRIVQGQVVQNKIFFEEEDLQNSFSLESKDLYFVLMSLIECYNIPNEYSIPQIAGILDLLIDYLTEEYHKELNQFFPMDDYDDEDEDEDDFEDDDD